MRLFALPLLSILFASCGSGSVDHSTLASQDSTGTSSAMRSAPDDRDRWMKPEVVIEMMGGDLTGFTVADLFADDGYFTFKLIDAGANVIAMVNDAAHAERINARKQELGLSDERLRVRAVAVGDPGLTAEEADLALIVHAFTGILDKSAYFERMRKGIRHPRPLFMLEWQYRETRMGPPMSERMDQNDVMDFFGTTGYAEIGAHTDKIPDQVVYVINDYFDPSEAEGN